MRLRPAGASMDCRRRGSTIRSCPDLPVGNPRGMCYMLDRCEQKVSVVILPKDRDPRFVTIRRGGTLTDSDHQLLALWAAS